MNLPQKIGNVEQLELMPADEFADVEASQLAEWVNMGHAAIKMAVRRLAIHVAQVGAFLVAAKDKCQHGEWLPWLAENCPEISHDTATRYMKTYDKMLDESNYARMRNLTPTQAYRELGIVKDPSDPMPVETPPLPEGKYNVIYADPPWEHDNLTIRGAAQNHYQIMSLDDICELREKIPVAEDAVLLLWATAPMVRQAFTVIEAWGFEYRTHAVWDKEIIGIGWWFRNQHELLLVGRRGTFSPPEESNRFSSVIRSRRKSHSKKPVEVYEMIEQMYPDAKYLELFARSEREGWTPWGNEMEANHG